MRHGKATKKLGRKKAHREAMIKNLIRSLVLHERIKTTISKAKLLKSYIDRLMHIAKEKSVANNRILFKYLQSRDLVKQMTDEIAPRFQNIDSGFVRIFRLNHRPGDNAEMALVEFTIKKPKTSPTKKESDKKK